MHGRPVHILCNVPCPFFRVYHTLSHSPRKAQVRLTEADKLTLINVYFSLDQWPDSLPTLEYLRKKAIRIGFLSNMTDKMLDSCIQHNRLNEYFEAVLSTDQRKTYKPSPSAYQMGLDTFHVIKSEILFVASGRHLENGRLFIQCRDIKELFKK